MQKHDLEAGDSTMLGNGVLPQSIRRAQTTQHVTRVLGFLISLNLASGCSGDTNNTGAGGSGGSGGSGGGGSSNLDSGTPDGYVSCVDPSDPLDTYLPNMSKLGSNMKLTFTLVQSNNAPPIRNSNIWKLRIDKADPTAPIGDVVPEVNMPKHGHPAGLQPTITFDPNDGLHTANPVFFSMPGYWASKFTVYKGPASDAEIVDTAIFYFCID